MVGGGVVGGEETAAGVAVRVAPDGADVVRIPLIVAGAGPDTHRGPDHDDWRQRAGCPPGYGGLVRTRLLEREAELRALTRQVRAVRAGAGQVIVVDGPAGIGKTSLLGAVADGAEADGVAVLRARSGPLEQDAAWGVARQLFEPLRAGEVWGELAVGAAKLATRALDPATAEPANLDSRWAV